LDDEVPARLDSHSTTTASIGTMVFYRATEFAS